MSHELVTDTIELGANKKNILVFNPMNKKKNFYSIKKNFKSNKSVIET